MNCIITFKVTVNGIVADDDCLKHATTLKMTITPYWLGRPASGGWPQSTPCRSRARPSPPTPAACSGRCHAGTWEGGAAQTARHITKNAEFFLLKNYPPALQKPFLKIQRVPPLYVEKKNSSNQVFIKAMLWHLFSRFQNGITLGYCKYFL